MEPSPEPDLTLLRVAVPDRAGSLAGVAGALAAAGVDIVRIEVVSSDGATAVDDILVRGAGAEQALVRLHAGVRLLAVREHAMLPDPGLAMAAACELVTDAHSLVAARRSLLEAALALVDAQRAVLFSEASPDSLEAVASTVGPLPAVRVADFPAAAGVLAAGAAFTASGDVAWAPSPLAEPLAGGAVVVVPVGEARGLALCVVREDWFPFVEAEVERLRALGRVAVGVLRAYGEEQPAPAPSP